MERIHYVAHSAGQRDVLFAVEHVGDGRAHAATQSGLDFEKFFALIGAVGEQAAVGDDLEYQVAGGGHRSAADAAAERDVPFLFLGYDVPGD